MHVSRTVNCHFLKRLTETVKKESPRLLICLLADNLYVNDSVFQICWKNKWDFLIRYKKGSIPSIMKECREIVEVEEMGKGFWKRNLLGEIEPETEAADPMGKRTGI